MSSPEPIWKATSMRVGFPEMERSALWDFVFSTSVGDAALRGRNWTFLQFIFNSAYFDIGEKDLNKGFSRYTLTKEPLVKHVKAGESISLTRLMLHSMCGWDGLQLN